MREDACEQVAQRMARWFLSRCRGLFELDDLLQEARLSAWQASRSFDSTKGMTLQNWACRVIRQDLDNLRRNRMRQKRGSGKRELRLPITDTDCWTPDEVATQALSRIAAADRLRRALERTP